MEIKVPIAELRKRKLFLSAPCYGGVCTGMFAKAVADLTSTFNKLEIPFNSHLLFNESLITRARNYCTDEFLRSDATHMVFIDSDIGFKAQDVLCMLAMQSDDTPYDILAAAYPKKCIAWEKVLRAANKGFGDQNPNDLEKFVGDFVFNPRQDHQQFQISEPVPVLEAGTGFMMIRRKTFENFRDYFPQYHYKPDHIRSPGFTGERMVMQYFQAEIDKTDWEKVYRQALEKVKDILKSESDYDAGDPQRIVDAQKLVSEVLAIPETRSLRYLSEDYWFCQKCQEIGMQVWLCPWMELAHVGSYVFGGSLAALSAAGASPTADGNEISKIHEVNRRRGIR